MGFKLFSNLVSGVGSPIAVNFGSSSVKLLQVGAVPAPGGGTRHILRAAAELPIPDDIRGDADAVLSFCEQELPRLLRDAGFRGRRVVCTVPIGQTIIQHMQLASASGVDISKPSARAEAVKAQLQVQMGIHPSTVVVRAVDVGPTSGGGGNSGGGETICFAMPRDVVMRYVSLLEKSKLEIVGVHTETMSMVRAFDHIHQRAEDENVTTMYIDLGWGGTSVAIAHGQRLVFARYINVGGRHFDEKIAAHLKSDLAAARAHRLSLEDPLQRAAVPQDAPPAQVRESAESADPQFSAHPALRAGPMHGTADAGTQSSELLADDRRTGAAAPELHHSVQHEAADTAPTSAATVDLSELLDTTIDELSMCVRYHHGLFPGRSIDRAVFLGGEARQQWLCQHLARGLRLPARLGDPLARLFGNELSGSGPELTPGLNRDQPQPGWAVPWGLCVSANT